MKKGGSESGEFLRWDVSCCLHLKQSGTVSAVREATLRLSPSASLGASAKQGRFSRKAREMAHPQLFRSMSKKQTRYTSPLKWPTRHSINSGIVQKHSEVSATAVRRESSG